MRWRANIRWSRRRCRTRAVRPDPDARRHRSARTRRPQTGQGGVVAVADDAVTLHHVVTGTDPPPGPLERAVGGVVVGVEDADELASGDPQGRVDVLGLRRAVRDLEHGEVVVDVLERAQRVLHRQPDGGVVCQHHLQAAGVLMGDERLQRLLDRLLLVGQVGRDDGGGRRRRGIGTRRQRPRGQRMRHLGPDRQRGDAQRADERPVHRPRDVDAQVIEPDHRQPRHDDAAECGEHDLPADGDAGDARTAGAGVYAVLSRLEVALPQGLRGGVGGRPSGGLRVLLAADGGPADAQVEDASGRMQPVEHLEGVIGHLLQAHRAGGPVLTPQLHDQSPVRCGRDELSRAQPGRQQLGCPRHDVSRSSHVVGGVVGLGAPDRVDHGDDACLGGPPESRGRGQHGGPVDHGADGTWSVQGRSGQGGHEAPSHRRRSVSGAWPRSSKPTTLPNPAAGSQAETVVQGGEPAHDARPGWWDHAPASSDECHHERVHHHVIIIR